MVGSVSFLLALKFCLVERGPRGLHSVFLGQRPNCFMDLGELINFRFCLLMEKVDLYLSIPKRHLSGLRILTVLLKQLLMKVCFVLDKKIPNYAC